MPARRADPPALAVTTELRSGDELLHGREQLLRLIEAQPDLVGALDAVRALQGHDLPTADGAVVTSLPEANHDGPYRQPQRFATMIDDFLDLAAIDR